MPEDTEDPSKVTVGFPWKMLAIKGEGGICSPFVSSGTQDVTVGSHGATGRWRPWERHHRVWQKWLCCWQKHCSSVGNSSHWEPQRNYVEQKTEPEKRNTFADINSWWCPLISTWKTLSCGLPKMLWKGLFFEEMGFLISGDTGSYEVFPNISLISSARV